MIQSLTRRATPASGLAWALCALALSSAACVTPRPEANGADADPSFASLSARERPWSVSSRSPALASRDGAGAWSAPAQAHSPSRHNIMEIGYSVYRAISAIDGPRCEHRPTCSRYAMEALRAHGFVVGSWLSIDRLLRSGRSSTLRSLPVDPYPGGVYYTDPVEENDFFF